MAKKSRGEFEALVDTVADDLLLAIEALPEAEQPYGATKLTTAQQFEQYLERRNDPEAWRQLIQQHGLGPVVRYARRFERKYRREVPGGGP